MRPAWPRALVSPSDRRSWFAVFGRASWPALGLCFLGLLVTPSASAEPLVFEYDELGRLRSAVGANGATDQYEYDAVGNVLRVVQTPAGSPVITDFTPNAAPVGATVQILGANFAPAVAGNTIKFNGTVAAVAAATPTRLTTKVPAGAVSGKLSVSTSAGTASSAQTFQVSKDAGVLAPVITSFTPAAGGAGTRVTIAGQNFDPAAGGSTVTLNGRKVNLLGAASNALLAVEVPRYAGSGPWKVKTTAGEAVGPNDFVVLPSGIVAADILRTYRLALGQGPRNVALDQPNKSVVVLYENLPGAGLTLQISGLTTTPSGRSIGGIIMSPAQTEITRGALSASTRQMTLPVLDHEAGWVSVFLKVNAASATGALTATLLRDEALPINAAPKVFTPSPSLPMTRITFSGVAGQNLGLGVLDATQSPQLEVYKPDRSAYLNAGGATRYDVNLNNLPMTGTYSLLLKPLSTSVAGSFKILLSTEVTGVLTPSVAQLVSISRMGQNARFIFTGAVGQNLSLAATGVTRTGGRLGSGEVSVYRPDRTFLTKMIFRNGQNNVVALPTLTTAGIYTVFIDPNDADSASMTLTLQPR